MFVSSTIQTMKINMRFGIAHRVYFLNENRNMFENGKICSICSAGGSKMSLENNWRKQIFNLFCKQNSKIYMNSCLKRHNSKKGITGLDPQKGYLMFEKGLHLQDKSTKKYSQHDFKA